MPSSYVNYLTLLLLLIDKCYLGGSEPTQLKEHVGMFYWPDTHPFFNRLVLSGSEPTQLKSQVGIFYRPDTHQLFIIYYYTKYYFVILFYIVINNFPLTFPIFVLSLTRRCKTPVTVRPRKLRANWHVIRNCPRLFLLVVSGVSC